MFSVEENINSIVSSATKHKLINKRNHHFQFYFQFISGDVFYSSGLIQWLHFAKSSRSLRIYVQFTSQTLKPFLHKHIKYILAILSLS